MKKTLLFFLCLFMAFGQGLHAQCDMGITLNTQASVDDFDCVNFTGNLTISGSGITNVDIPSLETLDGRLIINENDNLVSISFSNLKSHTKGLTIRDNPVLNNISFPSIVETGTSGGFLEGFTIENNDLLVSINTFGELESINSLSIRDNDILESVDGFDSLQSVSSFLLIVSNNGLTSIDGFGSLQFMSSFLSISGNNALKSINGFSKAQTFSTISIRENDVLTDVNAFENLQILDGLTIDDNNSLVSISGFDNVQNLGGFEITNNDVLTNIDLLNNVQNMSGNFSILGNASLTSIGSFDNLKSIGSFLSINGNSNLLEIDGLDNLETVDFGLIIQNNNSLEAINTFGNLQSIRFDLDINNNASLNTLNTFGELQTIGGELLIRDNPALTSINSFEVLQSTGTTIGQDGTFIISDNDALESIAGFGSLVKVGGSFRVDFNPVLQSISGFEQFNTIDGSFNLRNNSQLALCCGVETVLTDVNNINLSINIANNLPDCNSRIEILDACNTPPQTWYADTDMDTFGDPNNTTQSSTQPTGFVDNADDCDDTNANIFPNATETCDGIDNNCNNQTDEGLTTADYYPDGDGDGFGDANAQPTVSCSPVAGSVDNNLDCDDTISTANPNEVEIPNNGIDDNCNGQIDENNPPGTQPEKVVLIEGTAATWGKFTPRQYTFVEQLSNAYDNVIFVNVHGNSLDPMDNPNYTSGLGFDAYPQGKVDRATGNIDPFEYEDSILQRLNILPPANVAATTSWDAQSREVTMEITGEFSQNISGDYRLAAIVVEDSIMGTSPDYDQQNEYSGGGLGPMGGYENLPDPIPADQIKYNNVGRATPGGINGSPASLPNNINAGETHSYSYSYTVPVDYDEGNMRVIGILVAPDGSVLNAGQVALISSSCTTTSTLTFTSQSQLDAYTDNCPIIDGDLIINGDDITDLSNLINITEVTGNVIIGDTIQGNIGNDILTNLNGLGSISDIGGDLIICQNPMLISLSGFSMLMSVGGDIRVKNCIILETFNIVNLNFVGGDLFLFNLPGFGEFGPWGLPGIGGSVTFDGIGWSTLGGGSGGFSTITFIGGDFFIQNNPNLTQADVSNIIQLLGCFHVINNTVLVEIPDLSSLEEIGEDLVICENTQVTNVDVLASLESVGGNLKISGNPILENLDSLINLISVGDSLIITNNEMLSACCGLVPILAAGGASVVIIENNPMGCNDENDILTTCQDVDMDGDGFNASNDCDDTDATINPAATEICDGMDNNCDGQIDEGFTGDDFYVDNDGDGYGDSNAQPVTACSPPTGYVDNNLDCNDSDAAINPTATEVCDGIDNNCDGQVDEINCPPTGGCSSLTIYESNGDLVVEGLDNAPVSELQVFDDWWSPLFNCFGNCGSSQTLNYGNGVFNVIVKYYDDDYQTTCDTLVTIQITDNNNPTPPAPCLDLVFNSSNNLLEITGINQNYFPEIKVLNSDWEPVDYCFKDDCDVPYSMVLSAGLYRVIFKYFDQSYDAVCDSTITVVVTDNLIGNTVQFELETVKHDEHAEIIWMHNGGENVLDYMLQKSADGISFENMETVLSENNNQLNVYKTYDLNPFEEDNYYRILMNKKNGEKAYSIIKKVVFPVFRSFTIIPNPANDFAKIDLHDYLGGNAEIKIVNNFGQQVQQFNLDNIYSKYYQMDLRNLKEGHYVIWVMVETRKPVAKQLVIGKR